MEFLTRESADDRAWVRLDRTRRSTQWETEIETIDHELTRLEQPNGSSVATAEKTLELAQRAGFLFESQDPPNSAD
jgi:hypothetical protein